MGEAKRRAQRRAEAVADGRDFESQPAPQVEWYTEKRLNLRKRLLEQIRLRHTGPIVAKYRTLDDFIIGLIEGGIDLYDHEAAALRAHAEGGSQSVAPEAPAADDRLVVPAAEVPTATRQVLEKLHDGNVTQYAGMRTPR